MLKVLIFPTIFKDFGLLSPLLACHSFAIRFQNMQYRIGFINVFDALIESMLDHRTVTPKSKNERHAAWERSGAKRNERHAAWERFSCFHGPVGCLKELPRRSHQTFIFKPFFANFVLRDPLGGRSRRALHIENMQYRNGFIDDFDALIESMLDHRTVAPQSKNECHAAWERFSPRLMAQNGSPENAPNHLF